MVVLLPPFLRFGGTEEHIPTESLSSYHFIHMHPVFIVQVCKGPFSSKIFLGSFDHSLGVFNID